MEVKKCVCLLKNTQERPFLKFMILTTTLTHVRDLLRPTLKNGKSDCMDF